MKKFVRYAMYVLAVVAVVVIGLLSYVTLALPNVGAAPELTVEITPEKVERGEYLAWHVMMCVDCHAVRDFSQFSGPPVPGTELTGGEVFDMDRQHNSVCRDGHGRLREIRPRKRKRPARINYFVGHEAGRRPGDETIPRCWASLPEIRIEDPVRIRTPRR